mmetsp:Transcript_40805/g.105874  ORF Transcript_40805/g.105874 Transcript_40805/m.105874 type:complete len:136 (+) Transcript_40805:2277-2684(+)
MPNHFLPSIVFELQENGIRFGNCGAHVSVLFTPQRGSSDDLTSGFPLFRKDYGLEMRQKCLTVHDHLRWKEGEDGETDPTTRMSWKSNKMWAKKLCLGDNNTYVSLPSNKGGVSHLLLFFFFLPTPVSFWEISSM